MGVVTISAALGTEGLRIAEELASRAHVPLLDRRSLAALAHELEPRIDGVEDVEDLEARVGGRLDALALSLALTAGAGDAFWELHLRRALPALGRTVLQEAARRPAVIVAPAAFAALADRPGALHVRLHAPVRWRVQAYGRERVVDRRCAEKAVRHDDHQKRAWVRALYHVDLEDAKLFSLALDASRLPPDRSVELLCAAAGVPPAV